MTGALYRTVPQNSPCMVCGLDYEMANNGYGMLINPRNVKVSKQIVFQFCLFVTKYKITINTIKRANIIFLLWKLKNGFRTICLCGGGGAHRPLVTIN